MSNGTHHDIVVTIGDIQVVRKTGTTAKKVVVGANISGGAKIGVSLLKEIYKYNVAAAQEGRR